MRSKPDGNAAVATAETDGAEGAAQDEDEDIEVVLMTTAELEAAIAGGSEAIDAKTVTAYFLARQVLGSGG